MRPRLPLAPLLALAGALPAQAYDLNDNLVVGGVLAAVGQCQRVSARLPDGSGGLADSGDECRGAMPFQLEVSLRPDEHNEFFLKLSFAVDNGLSAVSPWTLAPWAADLEHDVQDVNGRGREYLLAAWYKHTFTIGDDSRLGATIGILDSTDYLDGNAYANDEYSQFMNEAFVNSGSYGLPSHDAGAAVEWASGPWSLNTVAINVGEDDDGNDFSFWGVQAGYAVGTTFGAGNYRLIVAGASSDFLDPDGIREEGRLAWGLSLDQQLGEAIGAFLRVTWREDEAAVDYRAVYAGGLDFNGGAWGREGDNIGIGYAWLDGGNGDIDGSRVAEAYYRAAVNDYLALTADVQYLKDDRIGSAPGQEDPQGWVVGLRLTAEL